MVNSNTETTKDNNFRVILEVYLATVDMHGFAGIVPMQCRVKKGSFVVHFYNLYSMIMIQSST